MTRSEHTHAHTQKSKINAWNRGLRLPKDGLYLLHITNSKDAWDPGACYIMSPLTQTTGPCLLLIAILLLLIYKIIQ